MCQVSLGLKGVQMGTHDFKHNKVPIFARKPENIITSSSAALKLAFVPLSRYYCDDNLSNHNVFSSCSKTCEYDLRSAGPKLALVPPSRYNCDIY